MMSRERAIELTPSERDAFRAMVLARSTNGRINFALAIEDLMRHPATRPHTRQWILDRMRAAEDAGRRVYWPPAFLAQGRPSAAHGAVFRGAKALSMAAPHIRRGGFWRDVNGREVPISAYDGYESDDMSVNEPFRFQDPETGAWYLGRQSLCTLDVASAGWLGGTCVGRPRDAYRMEDIADHFRDVCELHGLPAWWRLEKGTWASSFVEGIAMEGRAARWGGLDALFQVVHTQLSRGKGLIEQRFHLLQSFMGHTEGGMTMGRVRGEFERVTSLMTRAGAERRRAGDEPVDPGSAGRFWEIAQAADALSAAMERANARPVERGWAGGCVVPAEVLQQGGTGRSIPDGERWRFHPVKRTGVVRRGVIEIRLPGYPNPYRFHVNGVDGIDLDDNYPIFLAFHPGRPEQGCAVANRAEGRRNRHGWAVGEVFLHAAPYAPLMPQVDLRTESGSAGPGIAGRYASGVRAEFRGIREQLDAYKAHRARAYEAAAQAPESARRTRSEGRDHAGNRIEHAGVRAPVPDISALRRSSEAPEPDDPPTRGGNVDLDRFRGRSLFSTDEEREQVRFG